MLSKYSFSVTFMTAIAPFAVVGVDPVMLGVFLVAMGERWTLMTKSLDSYIKNAPSIYSMHLSLACSLPLLRITNIAERRGEPRDEKMSCLKDLLGDLGSRAEVHENRKFVAETLGKIPTVLLLASVQFGQYSEFLAMAMVLFGPEVINDLVRRG